ncbi:ArdC-like ssDNA-binding domain-containing protein, partial [Rhizobium leguminosarum]
MSRQQSNQRTDIHSRITNTIIADLEGGVRPWTKPWTTGHATAEVGRPLRHNGQPYSGINVLLLWSQAIACGFASSRWMTFRQAIE